MTHPDLAALLDQYCMGLEAEIALLKRLEQVAARQRAVSSSEDLAGFTGIADERDRLMAGLVAIEQEVRALRDRLTPVQDDVRELPAFEVAVHLHRAAVGMVANILQTDQGSLQALAEAESARRAAARALENGETTLAAYRRLAATPPHATLVSKKA
jgi:hypothetical protein